DREIVITAIALLICSHSPSRRVWLGLHQKGASIPCRLGRRWPKDIARWKASLVPAQFQAADGEKLGRQSWELLARLGHRSKGDRVPQAFPGHNGPGNKHLN